MKSIPRSARAELEKLKLKIEKKLLQLEQKDSASYQYPEFKQVVQNTANKAAKFVNMKTNDIMDYLLQYIALEMSNKKVRALDDYRRFNYKNNALKALTEIGSINAVEAFKRVFKTLRQSSNYFNQILTWPNEHWQQFSDQDKLEMLQFVINEEMKEAAFVEVVVEFDSVELLYTLGMVHLLKDRHSVVLSRLEELTEKTDQSEVDLTFLKLVKLYVCQPSKKYLESRIQTECNIVLETVNDGSKTECGSVSWHLTSESLPDELLVAIAEFVDAPDLISLSYTCKEWHGIANSDWIWESLCGNSTVAATLKRKLEQVSLMDGKILYFLLHEMSGRKQSHIMKAIDAGLRALLTYNYQLDSFTSILGDVQERLFDKYLMVSAYKRLGSTHTHDYATACESFYTLVIKAYQSAHSVPVKTSLRSLLERGVAHAKHADPLCHALLVTETNENSKATSELVSFLALCYVQHKCASKTILSYILDKRGKELITKMVQEKLIPKALYIRSFAMRTADLLLKGEFSENFLVDLVDQLSQTEDGIDGLLQRLLLFTDKSENITDTLFYKVMHMSIPKRCIRRILLYSREWTSQATAEIICSLLTEEEALETLALGEYEDERSDASTEDLDSEDELDESNEEH